MISRTKLAQWSLLGSLVLTVGLVSPIWADDDDNKRSQETPNEIDCGDINNANHDECKLLVPPAQTQQTQTGGQEQPAGTTTTPPASDTQSSPSTQSAPAPAVMIASPHDVLLSLPDAGKEATRTKLEEGSDAKGQWARARYERRTDSGAVESLGPIVIDHMVYVAPSHEVARQTFNAEKDKNTRFPEKGDSDKLGGAFPWNLENLVEQTAALSACNDCNGKDQLYLHHRIVQQDANVVSVLYLYGRDKRGAEEITTQSASAFWARKIADRI